MNTTTPVDPNLPEISSLMTWVDQLDPLIKIGETEEEQLRDLFKKAHGLI